MNKKIINLKNNETSLINGGDCLCICGAFNIQYSDDQSQAYINIENWPLAAVDAASYLRPGRSTDLANCKEKCTPLHLRATCIPQEDSITLIYEAMPPSPIQKNNYFSE